MANPVPYQMKISGMAIPETPPPQSPSPSESIESFHNHPRTQREEVQISNRPARSVDASRTDSVGHKQSTQWKGWSDTEYQDRQEVLSEVFELQKKLNISRDEIRTLERERAVSDSTMLQTHGDANEYIKELKKKQSRIDNLKAQQYEHAFLKPFFSLGTGQINDLDFPGLRQKYAGLRSQLVDAGLINDYRTFPQGKQRAELFASSYELQALQRRLGSPFGPDVESGSIGYVSAQHLVQSLVAVAVRDWVFYEKFTSTVTMEFPLLDAYRQHLSTLCMFNCLYLACC
jgi:hypothetical protein